MNLAWSGGANSLGDTSLQLAVTHLKIADWKPFLATLRIRLAERTALILAPPKLIPQTKSNWRNPAQHHRHGRFDANNSS